MAHIAWIEDNHELLGSLVSLIERDGHTVLRFTSFTEVKGQIDTICACDAVILDVLLPPAEEGRYLGVSVLEFIREERKCPVPVVICSGVKNPEVFRRLEKLGVTDILHKPVRPSVLYDVIKRVIGGD